MKNMGKLYQSVRDTILLAMKDANKGKIYIPLQATACPS
jgi:hypothetical protein